MTLHPHPSQSSVVGRVLGLDPATPFTWFVALGGEAFLQVGDLVQTTTLVPDGPGVMRRVRLSGIVAEAAATHEGVTFASDVYLTADGRLPANISRTVRVRTTRVQELGLDDLDRGELWVPPQPGDEVLRVTGAEREAALYLDQMRPGDRIPVGFTRDGQPYMLDFAFLGGEKGGHVNISGISGVATKTTFASLLLYSMFHAPTVDPQLRRMSKAVIFNVKGEDLLFLDQANTQFNVGRGQMQAERYSALGLPTGAFRSVSLRVPAMAGGAGQAPMPDITSRPKTDPNIQTYWWTVRELIEQHLLRYCFSEGHDHGSQITDLAMHLEKVLAEAMQPVPSQPWAVSLPKPGGSNARIVVENFEELVSYLELQFESENQDWTGRAAGQTLMAMSRRLRSATRHLKTLFREQVAPGDTHRVNDLEQQVTVIDIHNLAERAQRFVVGVILSRLFQSREGKRGAGHVFVVLDELNKYAPREGDSPLKEVLLDIAERGRSLGVLLIGAQQTASEVERRIVGNAAVRIVGRLDMAEAQRPEYAYLDGSDRARVGLLKPGSMLALQPHVPMAVEITFPFPCWATRASEAPAMTGPGSQGAAAGPVLSDLSLEEL